MGTVSIPIAGDVVGGVNWVQPVVIVVKGAIAIVTAVLTNKCLVRITHAGVDVGNDQAGTIKAEIPGFWCQNMSNVWFDSLGFIGH